MELVPQPLAHLLRRVDREVDAAGALFDLPVRKMWSGTPDDLNFSRSFHGETVTNVVGPAAGPHTQLAQNIALSYLAGSRILELKTVQILDELKIPRPCIDATNIGFNVEWSQELRVEQSRDEYAKAALLLAAIQRREGLPELAIADRNYLLDLSLGYDLAGIQTEKITGFVKTMLDASNVLDRLVDELPADLAHYRDLTTPSQLISCVTLSTFHGCPADEIELIARYLLEEVGVHVVVKLNPTLLGFDRVQSILHDDLGYDELSVAKKSFDEDLKWDQALEMIARLRGVAKKKRLMFGVKLTNTLVVKNHKEFFPETEKEMYLSGQPLHVLSTQLLADLRESVPMLGEDGAPPVVYSFSAGIDQHNFAAAAAADLCPVTTCTDLLRPGGYGRLPKYLDQLAKDMRKVGVTDVETYILRVNDGALPAARSAADAVGVVPGDAELAARKLIDGAPMQEASAHIDDAARFIELWVHAAGTINSRALANGALTDPRYKKEKNSKVPKKIGSALELFDCVNCDKCIPVCPNDANFWYAVKPTETTVPIWQIDGEQMTIDATHAFEVGAEHQLATYVDFCNGCGNCDIFCPEDGGPYVMKPHWFGDAASFEAEPSLDGFYLESASTIAGRVQGVPVRLTVDPATQSGLFSDPVVELDLEFGPDGAPMAIAHRLRDGSQTGEHRIDGGQVLVMRLLLDGIRSTVNPVSVAQP